MSADAIFGFIQFVRWPLEEQVERWQICEARPASAAASETAGPGARGKQIVRVHVAGPEHAQQCQILDLTALPQKDALAWLQRVRQLPVLTIGAGEPFCTAGGVACTRAAASGGGFEINLSAAQLAGLRISAQLLMQGRKRDTLGAAK